MREFIRILLFPVAALNGGEFSAKAGTLKCKFLTWLYEDPEPVCDGWVHVDDLEDQ